jgi:cytochrome c oxidase assembly factor CtaG
MPLRLPLLLLTVAPAPAQAALRDLTAHWSPDPVLVIALAIVGLAYTGGIIRLVGRAKSGGIVATSRIAAMFIAIATLAAALVSPLDALADRMLSAHMVQHLLLMMVAAPALVWARPTLVLIWIFPRGVRQALGRAWNAIGAPWIAPTLQRPATAWILFCGSLAFWHLPLMYRWALESESRHALMHLTFLCAGVVFWSIVIEPSGKRRLDLGRTILFVFSAAVIAGLPGAVLTFAQTPIYHSATPPIPAAMTALEDQQLAGLVMWIPMDLELFGVAAALFAVWLLEMDRAQRIPSEDGATLAPTLLSLEGTKESGSPFSIR